MARSSENRASMNRLRWKATGWANFRAGTCKLDARLGNTRQPGADPPRSCDPRGKWHGDWRGANAVGIAVACRCSRISQRRKGLKIMRLGIFGKYRAVPEVALLAMATAGTLPLTARAE